MKQTLYTIITHHALHARWLNTLSFMENMGARKISACENIETVDLIQLKHAAEEHRHAYYLKRQIGKLIPIGCESYAVSDLLAGFCTKQYLHKLDMKCSRLLKEHYGLSEIPLKYAAYLFVTYAIELRADALYPIYQSVLDQLDSKVMVKSIILEEEGHLEEMTLQLEKFDPQWQIFAGKITAIESSLFEDWFDAVQADVNDYACSTSTLV